MCAGSMNCSCSGTAANTWTYWVTDTASTHTSTVWVNWLSSASTDTTYQRYAPAPRRQTAAEQQAAEERAARYAERQRAEEERRAAAKARAEELLLDHLDEEQRGEWQRERAFRVISADGERTYRIRDGWAGNVELLNEEGRAVRRYCIHPSVECPNEDNALAQKLLLETDEAAFLRTANMTRLAA